MEDALRALAGQRVLVTGAGGFIGSHLTERLVRLGARPRALVHYRSNDSWGWLDHSLVKSDVEVVAGDVCDRESVVAAMRGVTVVFHLAALIGIPYSYHVPASYVRTNIEGTLNVLQAARDLGPERVIHTSTSEVYGTARYVPIDESHPLRGQSAYAATKIGADKLAEAFMLSYGLPVVTVRPFNTFGPRQSARAVVPTLITQYLASDTIRLGNVFTTRDLNYVDDTVEAFALAAVSARAVGRTINIGSGREVSIEKLAAMVAGLVDRPVGIERDERRVRSADSEVERLVADNTTAREILGWTPSTTLEEGLRLTIAWMRQHMSEYRPSAYVV